MSKLLIPNYIYKRGDRIFKVQPYLQSYEPVTFSNFGWYLSFNPVPKEVYSEPYNWNYNISTSFVRYEIPPTQEEWEILQTAARNLSILERLNNLALTHKLYATSNKFGQRLYDGMLFDEIDEYDKTKEIGPILQAQLNTSPTVDPDSLIEAIKLKKKDLSYLFAYLIKLEYEVHCFLRKNEQSSAADFITAEFKKLKS